jgi:predicted metal-binding membrane protein
MSSPSRRRPAGIIAGVTRKPSLVETALGQERLTLAILLVGLPLACWAWVITMARDMYGSMTGSSAWMMAATWDLPHLLLLWAMWAAMMAGMMLPAAAPLVLLYARAARQQSPRVGAASQIYGIVGGYTLVWAVFSVAATVLQRRLATSELLTPMMEPATGAASAALLVTAGLYQLTPLKTACLKACRTPIAFLASRWRRGVTGAVRMGAEHGAYCLGCCWALMLLLFAGGVMNLFVVAALTAWVAVEKLAPFGEQSARISGALLLAAAGWVFFR